MGRRERCRWLGQSEHRSVRFRVSELKGITSKLSQERRLWPSIVIPFDLPETYPVNGIPTPVIQILAQYYKAILLPFEEWNRKNAQQQQQQQQRSMSGVQGQAGQQVPVGQHGMPGQIPGGDLSTQTVVPPTIPHIEGGSALPPHHPFPSSSQTHRQQPSASINMVPSGPSLQAQPDMLSGMSSSLSQPFLPQASPPDGSQVAVQGQAQAQAQDEPALPDAEGRKRKGTAEGDVKRVRQRTGMGLDHPIMVRIDNLQPILKIQTWLVVFFFRLTRDALIKWPSVQRRSHFCASDRGSFGRWASINHRDRF
jgi:hypothetical protein